MASRASFAVNDRASTPVAHTFTPQGTADLPVFIEAGSVPIGNKVVVIKQRRSGTKYKINVLFKNPVLVTEVINGVNVPKVQRTAYAELNLTFEETSSLQERKDTVGMFANMLASSQVMLDSTFTGLETIW